MSAATRCTQVPLASACTVAALVLCSIWARSILLEGSFVAGHGHRESRRPAGKCPRLVSGTKQVAEATSDVQSRYSPKSMRRRPLSQEVASVEILWNRSNKSMQARTISRNEHPFLAGKVANITQWNDFVELLKDIDISDDGPEWVRAAVVAGILTLMVIVASVASNYQRASRPATRTDAQVVVVTGAPSPAPVPQGVVSTTSTLTRSPASAPTLPSFTSSGIASPSFPSLPSESLDVESALSQGAEVALRGALKASSLGLKVAADSIPELGNIAKRALQVAVPTVKAGAELSASSTRALADELGAEAMNDGSDSFAPTALLTLASGLDVLAGSVEQGAAVLLYLGELGTPVAEAALRAASEIARDAVVAVDQEKVAAAAAARSLGP